MKVSSFSNGVRVALATSGAALISSLASAKELEIPFNPYEQVTLPSVYEIRDHKSDPQDFLTRDLSALQNYTSTLSPEQEALKKL